MNENETVEAATAETVAAKKPKAERVSITMTDGRVVEFPLSRKVDKTIVLDAAGVPVGTRFDYVNGETRTLLLSEIPAATVAYSACHGIGQKVGDSTAGAKEKELTIEDIVLGHDEIAARIRKGEWNIERGTGDSMAGASVIIQALVEVTKRDAAWVKGYLEKLLNDGKASGLTRQGMYASFRDPKSQVGQVIRRIEEERAASKAAFNADDLAAKMMAAA